MAASRPRREPASASDGWHLTYPAELPISARIEDIAAAMREHQVVIVAGETGSGKSTQLPKVCLALQLERERAGGADARRQGIAHTQPRRIAARSVAERVAAELGTELGDVVGYQVRFTDRSSAATRLKVMTDGILLAEIQRDPLLRRYSTVIVDEAHERSLNIDFILGYLKRLLSRRRDLSVVVTSATLDVERFSAHFSGAPVIEVSGRTYPVELRYREPADDQPTAIVDAVAELLRETPGDILVFFSGEREIRDAADALTKLQRSRRFDDLEVIPLFSRLSAAEQHRVFAAHSGTRVVLATNIAETSLTVPGIRYVVDTGLARISRYSPRTKVQRLPIEPISQASANQRAGRCGRVAPGICIRLYAEEDYLARPEFTEPEILRTSLASVILQMAALGLGDVARFPFVEPPDARSVQAGISLLEEIGAIVAGSGRRRGGPRLTAIGRQLARMPVDPRLGRMLVAASERGCLREVAIVAAALSMQDPRERPAEEQAKADQRHHRYADPTSDFAGILNLWRHLEESQRELSSSAFRRMCRADYLNYLRVREWQDLETQLREVARRLGLRLNTAPAAADAIHRALLTGMLSHIGLRDGERRDYLGSRGTRFAIFPGSDLFGRPPEFVMAAELVETSRLWARVAARMDPAWAEDVGAHLLKRTYSEPHWQEERAAAAAYERATLYGVPIVTGRRVDLARVDPRAARELFIRHALVRGEWDGRHRFLAENQRLLEEAEGLEHRARRRDIVVDEDTLFDFYDARVPAEVVSGQHFDGWWKRARRDDPDLLSFHPQMLVGDAAADVSDADFPREWEHDELVLPLDYVFEPGDERDGVTLDLPVEVLGALEPDDFSWPVPGLRQDLVVALLRSLPKSLRVSFVPAPDVARRFLAATAPAAEPLLDALERYLLRTTGVHVPRSAWDLDRVPEHLRLSFRVRASSGEVLGAGRDLAALQRQLAGETHRSLGSAIAAVERTGMTSWDLDEVPAEITHVRAGSRVVGYPALVDEGATAGIRVLPTVAAQAAAMPLGVGRLAALAVSSPGQRIVAEMDSRERLELGLAPHATTTALLADCWTAAVGSLLTEQGEPPLTRAEFTARLEHVRAAGEERMRHVVTAVRAALVAAHEVSRRLSGRAELALLPALADLSAQHGRLVYAGFVADAGLPAVERYPRYLAAMAARLDGLAADVRKDAALMAEVAPLQAAYLDAVSALPEGATAGEPLRHVRWLLEELRVSLWAQRLGTAEPVSAQRVRRALAQL